MKKSLLSAALLALSLAVSSPAWAGFPVVDIPGVTQQLIDYLTQLEQLDAQLNQYYNDIERLKRIEVPGLSVIRRINADIAAYKKTAGKYNELVGKYNSLADVLKQFQLVEATLKSKCAIGQSCSADDVKALNTRKVALIQNLNRLMDESIQVNTEESEAKIQNDYDTLSSITGGNPQTQGEVLAKLLELEAFNAKMSIQLREQLAKNQAQSLMIQRYQQQFVQEPELREIGNQVLESPAASSGTGSGN